MVTGLMQTFLQELVFFGFFFGLEEFALFVAGFRFLIGTCFSSKFDMGFADMVVGLGGGDISGERRGEDLSKAGGSDSERQEEASILSWVGTCRSLSSSLLVCFAVASS